MLDSENERYYASFVDGWKHDDKFEDKKLEEGQFMTKAVNILKMLESDEPKAYFVKSYREAQEFKEKGYAVIITTQRGYVCFKSRKDWSEWRDQYEKDIEDKRDLEAFKEWKKTRKPVPYKYN